MIRTILRTDRDDRGASAQLALDAAPGRRPRRPGITIELASGTGVGRTTLSAFDAALNNAGIQNYNLLTLSSVIPTGAVVDLVPRYVPTADEHGNLLYVVLAEARSERPGVALAAGLGWYQLEDGRGVFAEHSEQAEGGKPTDVEKKVVRSLRHTVEDLCSHRAWRFDADRFQCSVTSCRVDERPASVLVAAAYESRAFATGRAS